MSNPPPGSSSRAEGKAPTPAKGSERLCSHCDGNVAVRNPKGYCDHLKYPEHCVICKAIAKSEPPSINEIGLIGGWFNNDGELAPHWKSERNAWATISPIIPKLLHERAVLRDAVNFEAGSLQCKNNQLTYALRGLLNVMHDYLPHKKLACLRFEYDGFTPVRSCENTGSDPCELCAARKLVDA